MAGLILKLRAHEEVLVNGVVMQNGGRNARLIIKTPNVHILRLRDALRAEEVDTPVKRVCFLVQQVVAGETDTEEAGGEISRGIVQLREALNGIEGNENLDVAASELDAQNFYGVLRALRRLLPVEARLLEHADAAAGPLSSNGGA